MKKIIAITLALASIMVLSIPAFATTTKTTPTKTVIIGDVNGNGKIDLVDALLVVRHAMNISSLTEDQMTRADVNKDGNINLTDALLIIRTAMGITASV